MPSTHEADAADAAATAAAAAAHEGHFEDARDDAGADMDIGIPGEGDADSKRRRMQRDASISPPNSEHGLPAAASSGPTGGAPGTPLANPHPPDQLGELKNMFLDLRWEFRDVMKTQAEEVAASLKASSTSLMTLSESIHKDMLLVNKTVTAAVSRIEACEKAAAEQARTIDEQISARFAAMELANRAYIENLVKELPPTSTSTATSSLPSSSSGPAVDVGHGRPGAPARRHDEGCLIMIHDFPERLPRAVLLETFDELVGLLPPASRDEVKHRIGPADKQIMMIFPTQAKAETFLEVFREAKFLYVDHDTKDRTHLTAKKGRPIEVRRRGGVTHPVYAAVQAALVKRTPSGNPKLVQNFAMVRGTPRTEFHQERGRKITHLLTVYFHETTHDTSITTIRFEDGVFSDPECQAILSAAGLV
jgi:hypothetical protein